MVVVGVLRETAANETRVAAVPEIATKLKALGARILLESGAGVTAHFPDAAYGDAEISDAAVLGFMQAYARPDLVRAL
jgi:NAD(P) transhydrogenase subunit alpha